MKMSEKEMAQIIRAYDRNGIRFLSENVNNFKRFVKAYNYVIGKGVQNCSAELQQAFLQAKANAQAWVDSLSEPTPAELENMHKDLERRVR